MNDLSTGTFEQLAVSRANFTGVGLDIDPDVTFDEWLELGAVLTRIGAAHQWWIGDWLNFGNFAYGEKYAQAVDEKQAKTWANYCWVASRVETSRRREDLSFGHHDVVAKFQSSEQKEWLERAARGENGQPWTVSQLRAAIRERRADTPELPSGMYRCIVIDPPWPVDKIVRQVRPKQGVALDYPTMPLEQIGEEVGSVVGRQDGCHIYLWVTQRFLPAGLALFEDWDVAYECAFTWVKNVGPTPFSWMYDTEHVLFGRRGSLPLEQKGLRLSFMADAVGHSIKPDVFYERVVAASPGPRLAMFERGERPGFEVWGDEVAA